MAYIDYKYCYPYYQIPNACVTPQYNTQNCIAMQQCFYNAYQNQLRNLQTREIRMEYWTRQLEYFRNLLKNFAADIESPEDLKRLLATCNCNPILKKCFEKRRTFCNTDKLFCKCRCRSCLKKSLIQLCNALSNPSPCSKPSCETCCPKPCCGVNACQKQPSQPCYYYTPCQTPSQMPYYYYYSCSQQQMPPAYCCDRQPSTNCCSGASDMCCNKCRFNYILNKINWLLTSADQLKSPPCPCTCTCKAACTSSCKCAACCDNPAKKSCCSIQQIKEETIIVRRESSDETDVNKPPCERTTQPSAEACECEDSSESREAVPCKQRVTFNEGHQKSLVKSHSCTETFKCYNSCTCCCENVAHNCQNSLKKQVSISLGKEYRSPSGNFQVLIDQANNKSCCDGDYLFEVDYITYTMPKNQAVKASENENECDDNGC